MLYDIMKYHKLMEDDNICLIYNGPVWADGIEGMAEKLQKRLEYDAIPENVAQSIFSVFIEQMNNILLHSAEKESLDHPIDGTLEISKGIFILGIQEDKTYIIQSGNVVTTEDAESLKSHIDHLNTLDKQELRKFYREQIKFVNSNPNSKGAGIGMIEIARRTSSKIGYDILPIEEGSWYFTIYVTI